MKLIDCVTYIFIPIRKNNIAFVSKQIYVFYLHIKMKANEI
ncbi:MAG: hypothetical protein RIQ70_943 [Bacteroidota bacterium]|jgi:hypothetical protein